MTTLFFGLFSFFLFAFAVHLCSMALVVGRDVIRRRAEARTVPVPPLTILRPVRGLENHLETTLESAFLLDHSDYEILFCVDDGNDPVVPLCKRLMARHPDKDARLLVGKDPISLNPKLNNMVKGWAEARYDFVVMADSNVLMTPDYLQTLFAAWDETTGLVCSPPTGGYPDGLLADVECAFLNSFQGRWQLCADAFGLGFAQGKTMLWKKADLDAAGGIAALGSEVAEDAASTKVVREAGKRVRLVRRPFVQPLGQRTLGEVWLRQLRWARLRRASFPLFFAPEVIAGGFFPLCALAALAILGYVPAGAPVLAAVLWYGAEAALARFMGWPVSLRMFLAFLVRDMMLPVLWLAAIFGSDFSWRGNAMHVRRGEEESFGPAAALRWLGGWRRRTVDIAQPDGE
ncbi:hopanoid biosynthesis associated glycosyl transferase protein HpnI [Hartmannibacter diazotrophicus]|uniref:Hopanoid biosynthesis associated glycosyl transferase protein HpnI n=1 Tax=Hartmannibacter diazotrophicus TaxID=1482074 RepID=A0A2C9D7X9_9HYPH|nr:ceramide glucosyltransferase [Hartmannibacter diazotrophicus]SON56279.1 hopanoid biosynthesis associated glycosyl transferase protein HpnI [Hartmannibacter diazotrophicus]